MKEFIIEIESNNGRIRKHVARYEDDNQINVRKLGNYITRPRESKFFQFNNIWVNLDNVLSIKISEKTTEDNE
ncbi:hypothetical protein [Bacillus sp. SH5-2]|uniref:hypothetical protein n=1 Tax=Bacillus sp. SH5-2 TaxID=2217834 RepID=UPI0011EF9820|nr:hypothetical protein [Bacillus sp. SH5-2]KAA0764404.1 hypothetical protein DN410_11585 [Bacillus sp. SH5-2]